MASAGPPLEAWAQTKQSLRSVVNGARRDAIVERRTHVVRVTRRSPDRVELKWGAAELGEERTVLLNGVSELSTGGASDENAWTALDWLEVRADGTVHSLGPQAGEPLSLGLRSSTGEELWVSVDRNGRVRTFRADP